MMNKEDMPHIVVGGGIAGITSALILANNGKKVILIENAPQLGGLLSSHQNNGSGWYDYGTHILSETGNAELDRLLFKECYEEDWIQHKSIKSCSYFMGEISRKKFIDTRLLSNDDYTNGFNELINLPENYGPFTNLEERINATFGKIFSEKIFAPIMYKFTGCSLNELADNAHHLIGTKRLICSSAEETKKLKSANKWHDDRLAFHDPNEGMQDTLSFYPKKQGIGLWSDSVKTRLEESGVNVLTSTSVNKVNINQKEIISVIINNDKELKCEKLIWSVPVIFLLMAAGIKVTGLKPPSLCKMLLFDLLIDKPLLFDDFYLTCHDPSINTFRITNYQALQNSINEVDEHKLTVEVISSPGSDKTLDNMSAEKILEEMKKMKVISQDTKIINSWSQEVNQGFPLPTPDFKKDSEYLINEAQGSIDNAIFVGRTAGRSFFMSDVITEISELLN